MRNSPDPITSAIAEELKLLSKILNAAAKEVASAYVHIHRGERNGAIGIIAGLDTTLKDALALYGAALALHRSTPSDERMRGL